MEPASLVVAACLVILAVAHSVLGEAEILKPLFAMEWVPKPGAPRGVPRWASERVLRFAWHLLSVAWLALAAAALGVSPALAIAGMASVSAVVVFLMLRGHLAWPLFALAAAAAMHVEGLLSRPLLGLGVVAAAATCFAAALVHFYWAGGGRWGAAVAIPTRSSGAPAFTPPPWLTAAVGVALLVLGGLTVWVFAAETPPLARTLLGLATAVLLLRAVGDGKQVGFTKRDHASPFARWDDRLFTPLVVVLAFGAGAALVG